MAWEITPEEYDAVVRLPAPQRYAYAIRKLADCGEVWGLWNGAWVFTTDDAGREATPIWPHWRSTTRRFASS